MWDHLNVWKSRNDVHFISFQHNIITHFPNLAALSIDRGSLSLLKKSFGWVFFLVSLYLTLVWWLSQPRPFLLQVTTHSKVLPSSVLYDISKSWNVVRYGRRRSSGVSYPFQSFNAFLGWVRPFNLHFLQQSLNLSCQETWVRGRVLVWGRHFLKQGTWVCRGYCLSLSIYIYICHSHIIHAYFIFLCKLWIVIHNSKFNDALNNEHSHKKFEK